MKFRKWKMKKIVSDVTAILVVSTAIGGVVPAKSEAADTSVFTHKEWTGTAYTDKSGRQVNAEDVFAVNREGASVNSVPYQNTEAAVAAVWDYNAREESSYMQMLTGKGENGN